jgi:hypothetical protein
LELLEQLVVDGGLEDGISLMRLSDAVLQSVVDEDAAVPPPREEEEVDAVVVEDATLNVVGDVRPPTLPMPPPPPPPTWVPLVVEVVVGIGAAEVVVVDAVVAVAEALLDALLVLARFAFLTAVVAVGAS